MRNPRPSVVAEAAPSGRMPARAWMISVPIATLVAVLAVVFYAHRLQGGAPSRAAAPASIHSLALLPFSAQGDREEDQYLGLGTGRRRGCQTGYRAPVAGSLFYDRWFDPGSASGSCLGGQQTGGPGAGEWRDPPGGQSSSRSASDCSTAPARRRFGLGNFKTDSNNIFNTEDSIAQQVASALIPQFAMSAVKTGARYHPAGGLFQIHEGGIFCQHAHAKLRGEGN